MSDARTKIEFLYKEVLGDIHDLVNRVEEIKGTVPAAVETAAHDLQTAASALQGAAIKAETEKLQTAFTKVAEEVLQDIRRQAHAAAPSAWRIKVAVSLAFVVTLSGAAGAIVGAWYTKQARNTEEERQMAAGKDFLQVLPQLDQSTRDKLARLIEKNRP